MDELYALGRFNEDGSFYEYVRKGRNHSISGYDNISGARRGLSQTRANTPKELRDYVKIIKAASLEIVE